MSEIEDLMGVWGAIDHAVVDNPELAEIVGRYVGGYRVTDDSDGAAGWFDEFTSWTAESTDASPEEQFPSLRQALRNLAEIPPGGRRRAARRLHVVAIAARVVPALQDLDDEELHAHLVGTLTSPELAPEDRGEELLQMLLDDDLFPDLSRWSALLHAAGAAELIDPVMVLQSDAPPCSGGLVLVTLPDGDTDPVTTLSTSFCTSAITFERAKRFLEPSNWPDCNDFWCRMDLNPTLSPGGNPTYTEEVSLACNTGAWQAVTCLEFVMVSLPDRAVVVYNLCDDRPLPGDLILVDSGSLMVVDNGNEICVTTTKRILFNHPFSGEALSVISCALGYGAVAEDLVFCCALDPDNPNQKAGTPFPGVEPKQAPSSKKKAGPVDSEPSSPADKDADAVKAAMNDAVDAAKECLDDCVEAFQKSYDRVKDGKYKAEDMVQDMAAMWTRLIRDGATVVDLGMRASRASARASRRAAPPVASTATEVPPPAEKA